MPDCYLCGDYIGRGEGYRRTVQVDSSTRVYFSRRGGGSYGTRSALRTVCRRCAMINDESERGGWFRSTIYFLCFCLSVYVGWQMIVNIGGDAKYFGLIFLFGLPALAGSHLYEAMRRKAIVDGVTATDYQMLWAADDGSSEPLQISTNSANQLELTRVAPAEDPATSDHVSERFRADDTVISWAHRVAEDLRGRIEVEPEALMAMLVELAKFSKPRVGECARDFGNRVRARVLYLHASFKADPSFPLRRQGEGVRAWIERTAPVIAKVPFGESVDDLIPLLVEIGEHVDPPEEGENAMVWINQAIAHATHGAEGA